MKSKLKIVFVCISIISHLTSCRKSDPPTTPVVKDPCVTIYDNDSKAPLEDVSISWETNGSTPINIMGVDQSDVNGYWCPSDDMENEPNFFRVYKKAGWIEERWLCSQTPDKIYLQKYGYMRLHLKNVAPQDTADHIWISGFSGYKGANIDTTIISYYIDPRQHQLEWHLYHSMFTPSVSLIKSGSITYTLNSGWVFTDVDLFY